jgi:hypothetical protein
MTAVPAIIFLVLLALLGPSNQSRHSDSSIDQLPAELDRPRVSESERILREPARQIILAQALVWFVRANYGEHVATALHSFRALPAAWSRLGHLKPFRMHFIGCPYMQAILDSKARNRRQQYQGHLRNQMMRGCWDWIEGRSPLHDLVATTPMNDLGPLRLPPWNLVSTLLVPIVAPYLKSQLNPQKVVRDIWFVMEEHPSRMQSYPQLTHLMHREIISLYFTQTNDSALADLCAPLYALLRAYRTSCSLDMDLVVVTNASSPDDFIHKQWERLTVELELYLTAPDKHIFLVDFYVLCSTVGLQFLRDTCPPAHGHYVTNWFIYLLQALWHLRSLGKPRASLSSYWSDNFVSDLDYLICHA